MMRKTHRSWVKPALRLSIPTFLLINLMAFFHARKLMRFIHSRQLRTGQPGELSMGQKLKTLFMGVSNPRPENQCLPAVNYTTVDIMVKDSLKIEGWFFRATQAQGTVLLFHGYAGEKSSLIQRGMLLNEMGYHALLIDFLGSGGSDGSKTTVGFDEAQQVRQCVNYVRQKEQGPVILFGTSMGAVASMKAVSEHTGLAQALVLECPYSSMLQTVRNRFQLMHVPSFPLAHLLVFWGGLQGGFNGFSLKSTMYAQNIDVPVLLLHGEQDLKVRLEEIEQIYANLKGIKVFKSYPLTGHENFLEFHQQEWQEDVFNFLQAYVHIL